MLVITLVLNGLYVDNVDLILTDSNKCSYDSLCDTCITITGDLSANKNINFFCEVLNVN